MKFLQLCLGALAVIGVALAVWIGVGSYTTEQDIQAFRNRIEALAKKSGEDNLGANRINFSSIEWTHLPQPVKNYFTFVFPNGITNAQLVDLEYVGKFRRPLTEGFNHATAEQVIAISTPALMLSMEVSVFPGFWARAYDFFAHGEMEMKAKILSTFTVVDEQATRELNIISLRRWLLESALFPHALLHSGLVAWEPIDGASARAIIQANGLSASMIAHFDDIGRMTHMSAEEDGDLTTSYHGSGEHVTREDYRLVGGVMIPHKLTVSRAAGGEIFPFFVAEIISAKFH